MFDANYSSCGVCPGTSKAHLEGARALAREFHKNNIQLVYGGGTGPGLMGEIARTLVALSGPDAVHGVIPEPLVNLEQEESGLTDEDVHGRVTVVPDMHTRKQLMAKKVIEGGPGSGFVALSGGYGTMEELFEAITWNQLGIHDKGVVLFNIEGYYDGLISWVQTAVSSGFIAPGNAGILVEALEAEEVITQLKEYRVAEGRFSLDWNQK